SAMSSYSPATPASLCTVDWSVARTLPWVSMTTRSDESRLTRALYSGVPSWFQSDHGRLRLRLRIRCARTTFPFMSRVAFIYPGQGSQKVGMGREAFEQSRAAKAVFEAADDALGFSLQTLCFEGPEEALKLTANTQPAI